MSMSNIAAVSSGRDFMNQAGGRWAGERFLRAIREGRPISPLELRSNDTLRKDQWKLIDDAVTEEAVLRLRGVADLISTPGLVKNIPDAMGRTLLEYPMIGDMDDAVVSMDGLARSDNDRVDFSSRSVPLPITHKDFDISLRTLSASRNPVGGRVAEPLDTTQIRVSSRKVSEMLERMLYRGGPTFAGAPIYGYTNYPYRNTASFGTNGNWLAGAKTGDNMLQDILTGKRALQADGFMGPYWLYLPSDYSTVMDGNYVATYPGSIKNRLLQVDGLEKIEYSDQLPANNLVLIQPTPDVVQWGMGEQIQPIQWDIQGGFGIAFKVFAIQIPILRATQSGKSGIFHMS